MISEHERRQLEREQQFVASLAKVPPIACDLRVGDKVTFTNDYDVSFPDKTVVGFDHEAEEGDRFIYLDSDAWWFPHTRDQLTKQAD